MFRDEQLRLARRAVLVGMTAAGALGAGGLLGLVREALAADAPQGIRHIKGQVSVDGEPATIGQTIRPGQTISTGPGGETIVVLGADAFLIHGSTQLHFEGAVVVAILRYITGRVLSVFGQGDRQLVTTTATMGIRGTACYIEAEPDRTYFCLCYGEAEVRSQAAPAIATIVRTRHHEHPLYIGSAADRSAIVPAQVINHTDAELIMLENLVGRRPPFYGEVYLPYP